MKVLVINSGSSSIKFQFLEADERKVLSKGLVERIGLADAIFTYEVPGREPLKETSSIPDHRDGIHKILDMLVHPKHGVIGSLKEIEAVGHRMVHGGEKIKKPELLTPEVVRVVEDCIPLAPLHNPPNLLGLRAVETLLPDVPHVGVFDTAFHASMPRDAYIYALDYAYYEKHGIRRFGFHGTSHEYVAQRGAQMLNIPFEKFHCVTCHLGNGVSLTAVKDGHSVDTTLGYGTMCGVPMGTRAGDVDPAIILHLMDDMKMTTKDVHNLIYKQSGLKGMSGLNNDMRDIVKAAGEGNVRAQTALDVFAHCNRKYIAAMASNLDGRLDAIIFTAGIGENCYEIRESICKGLQVLGAHLDTEKNRVRGREAVISTADSPVKILVVPTNEELMIALETESVLKGRA